MLELRRALRSLLRHPGLSLLAVPALGLGIGLPTAMFSFLDAAVLRGLPVEEPHEILYVERLPEGQSGDGWGASPRDYIAWREQQTAFEDLAAFNTGTVTLRGDARTDRRPAAWVTPNAFALLGANAALGRAFGDGDASAREPVLVLGHVLWRDVYGSDPGVLGRTVHIDGLPHTITGVMPPDFQFPSGQELWLPLRFDASHAEAGEPVVDVLGRLREGRSRADAEAEFAVIASRLAERFPESNAGMKVSIVPFTERFLEPSRRAR